MVLFDFQHSTVSASGKRPLAFASFKETALTLLRDGALRQRPDRREDQRGYGDELASVIPASH
jgi:hypothetical protein